MGEDGQRSQEVRDSEQFYIFWLPDSIIQSHQSRQETNHRSK